MTDRHEIRTPRLLMRRWQPADLAPFAALNADPEVMRYFPGLMSRPDSDALARKVDSYFDEFGFGFWALERLDGGGFIGFTGLGPMPAGIPHDDGVEIGWRLARSQWGHGYATEAARAALGAGFERFGLARIDAITAVINEPSQRVMHKLGMARVTEFDHPKVATDSPVHRHVLYSIDAP